MASHIPYLALGSTWSSDGSSADQKSYVVTAPKIHDYYQDNCSSLDAIYSWSTSHLVSTLK